MTAEILARHYDGRRQKPGRNANPPEDREAVMQEIHELQLRILELLERMG